jgi:hypothetical protein
VLQRAVEESTVAAFVLRRGHIADPFLLHFAELASQPRSAEQILRGVLEPAGPDPAQINAGESSLPATSASNSFAELEDHLALLARWFYGRPRDGEIFFAEAKSTWPYRRILRACSRVLAPQPERQP